MLPSARLTPLAASALLAAPALAGDVHHVGPGQPFATIQAAVDAAGPGDLVLVEPGVYPRFTVAAKELSVVAAGASFSVQPSPGQPEIVVRDLAAGEVVTIRGAYVAYADPLAPAVLVTGNAGAVRFSELFVDQVGDLRVAEVHASVLVEDTRTFWLIDSRITGDEFQLGDARVPLCVGTRCNDGISGLQVTDTQAVLQNSFVRGYLNSYTALGSGGDGLRAVGESPVWLVQNRAVPSATLTLEGGPGVFGGNAVHQVRDPRLPALIRSCSSTGVSPVYIKGTGAPVLGGVDGGFFGSNNDNGTIQIRSVIRYLMVAHCDLEVGAEVVFVDPVVSVGSTSELRLRTLMPRRFVLRIADSTRHANFGRQIDGRAMTAPGGLRALLPGVTQAQTAQAFPFSVPPSAALVGTQLTAQAATGALGAALDAFSVASPCVIGP